MPPRSMWKGAISFGLVTIPVSVYPATEEKTLRFNQLHDEDGGRVRMKRVCSIDGEEVEYEHIVKGYEIEKERVSRNCESFADPMQAAKGADLVTTDVWTSMGFEAEDEARRRAFHDWQVDAEMMKAAKREALFMHCLPAHRGEEVAAEVIDGPQSVVWDEAENRLHVQKALLEFLFLGKK